MNEKIKFMISWAFCSLIILSLVIQILAPGIPHGELLEHSGYIINVDYSQGGYMTHSVTYITWADGNVHRLSGTSNLIQQQGNATLYYRDGRYGDFFARIEYSEENDM